MKKIDFINEVNDLANKAEPFIFIIDFEIMKPLVLSLSKATNFGIFYDIKGMTNWNYISVENDFNSFKTKPISKYNYNAAFRYIESHLLLGNTYLTNLTFPTEIENKLELIDIFNMAKAPYKLLFKDEFTVFSPECFIKIVGNTISSFPMKGTIDASIENAEEKILSDKKELYEHNTIVDLIRNDLSQVSEKVVVQKFRYIDRIKSNNKELLQVSSEISGKLPYNWKSNLGNIILKMLPAGSVSGAPKQKTLEIIKNAERQKRSYYTGIFGIFDGINLDSAVNIRYIEREKDKIYFRSGGGITALSDPDYEYSELLNKIYVPLG